MSGRQLEPRPFPLTAPFFTPPLHGQQTQFVLDWRQKGLLTFYGGDLDPPVCTARDEDPISQFSSLEPLTPQPPPRRHQESVRPLFGVFSVRTLTPLGSPISQWTPTPPRHQMAVSQSSCVGAQAPRVTGPIRSEVPMGRVQQAPGTRFRFLGAKYFLTYSQVSHI